MTKKEAYQEMIDGKCDTNQYFTQDEYLWYNSDKKLHIKNLQMNWGLDGKKNGTIILE